MKFKVLLVYPNLQLVNLIPNNMAILAACLKKEGFDVKLFDTTFYKIKEKSDDEIRAEWGHYKPSDNVKLYKTTNVFDDFVKVVSAYQPDVIGFTCVDATYKLALDLLNRIDTTNIHVTFGGVYPTFNADKLLKENPKINTVCIGEGEKYIVDLCKSIYNESVISSTSPNLTDINVLPYEDFTIFESNRFLRPMQGKLRKMIPLMIDRGCPYDCSFCAEPSLRKHFGYKYRVKSMDILGDYMEYMNVKYKPEYIYFNSETFFARPIEHIIQFAKLYKQKINLPFCCMTRFETINQETINIIADMGCDRISFGVEHGNDVFRKNLLNKSFTNDDIKRVINQLNDVKVPCTFFNMVGFPDETPKLALDTISINRWINDNYNGDKSFSVSVFQPYCSTPLRQYCINKGYINTDTDCGSLISECVLNMPQFKSDDIVDHAKNFIKLINQ